MTCRYCRPPRTLVSCNKRSIRSCDIFKSLPKIDQEEFKKKKNVTKRKNCENNFAELLFPLKLFYPDILTKKDVLDKKAKSGARNHNRWVWRWNYRARTNGTTRRATF